MDSKKTKPEGTSSTGGFSLEFLKAASLFLSSVVIALTGTLLTYRYNSNQLEINRNKELAALVPKLYSTDPGERRQSVVGLSLYGEKAVLPLISLWGNDGDDVALNLEIMNSIVIIGDVATPYLLKVFNNPYEQERKRSYALYALVRLNYRDSRILIKKTLDHIDHDAQVLTSATLAAGYTRYVEMTPKLVAISKTFRDHPDPNYLYLVKNIAVTLKYLGGPEVKTELKNLMNHPDPGIRAEAIKSMTVLGDMNDLPVLREIAQNDSVQTIRQLARYGVKAIEINERR